MAASSELNLVIGVVDKATGPLGKIAGSMGSLAKIGGAAFLGGAVAGVGALGAALVAGIGDAREANIIMAQTENVIKSTGGAAGVTAQQVADLSGSLSAAAGKSLFGDDQIQESANLLLTFTNLKGGVLDAATAMSVDLAQAMGGAPADAAVQLGKALNDPIAGISALSRVGVTFTDQQKAQIATMMEAGNVAGAQGVILAELNKEFGGSAAAAAAADGGMAQFKDRMGELAESVGAQVLPALNGLMAWLNSPEVQAGITAIVTGLVDGLGAAFTWISTVAMPALQTAFQTVWPIIQQAVDAAYQFFITTVWPWLQTAFAWLSDTGLPAVKTAFETVWPIIQTAVATVYTFFHDTVWPWLQNTAFPWIADVGLPAVKTAFETVWPVIQTAVSTVYNFFKDTVWPWLKEALRHTTEEEIPAIKKAFETAWPIIQSAVTTVYTFFKDTAWPWLSTNFENLRTWLGNVETKFNTAWPKIQAAVTTVYTFFKDTVWPWLSTALENVKTWIDGVQTRWNTAWSAIGTAVETAKSTISGAIATIKGLVDGAIDKINALITLINKIPGVNIPAIPTAPSTGGGGGSGIKSYTPPMALTSQSTGRVVNLGGITINNPRNAQDVEIGLKRALQSAGLA